MLIRDIELISHSFLCKVLTYEIIWNNNGILQGYLFHWQFEAAKEESGITVEQQLPGAKVLIAESLPRAYPYYLP